MDSIDRKLLELLQIDSRSPLKTLAGEVGLARSTVQERLKRLEADGTIARYTIETRDSGASEISAYLLIKTGTAQCAEIASKIVQMSNVQQCVSLGGEWDMLVMATAKSLEGLADLRHSISRLDGLKDLESYPVLKSWK